MNEKVKCLTLTKDVDWCKTDNVENLFDSCQTVLSENFQLVIFRHQIFGIENFVDHVDVPVARFQFSQYERSVDGHSLMISKEITQI